MRAAIWVTLFAALLVAPAAPVPASDTSTVAAGLVAHWSFDEATGTSILDASGNGHDGTLYGATRTDGVIGSALEFAGADEAWVPGLGIAPPSEITGLEVGSISMWLRYVDSDQEAEPLFYLGRFDQGGDKPGATVEVGHPNNNKLYFTFYEGSPRPTLCFDSNFDLEPGVWYHFVGVVGENYNTGYLNGIEMTDRNYNAGGPEDSMFFADLADPNRLTLGSAFYHQDYFLFGNGAVDEVRIYDRPLTAAEALALYTNTDPPENQPPTAEDDAATTTANSPVEIDVLANDTDPDGDALQVDSVTDPDHGTATTDGEAVTYTPDPDWMGADVFSYSAADAHGAIDSAEVEITIVDAGVTMPPETPESLAGDATGAGEIELTWSDMSSGPSQETHFELQRRNRANRTPWETIALVPADQESYVDSDVGSSSRYAYRIRAVNAIGASPWSNRIMVTAI